MSNPYCEALDIKVPVLAAVKNHREASPFSLMLVALLEHGAAMTLPEIANRFEDAGIAAAEDALRSLKRCRPARPPVYRDGDDYELDPHDAELDLWAFRLGLRPPKVKMLKPVPPAHEPLPGPETPLRPAELEEAFRDAYIASWSAQRLALVVLDSHGGRMPGAEVVQLMHRLTPHHILREEAAEYWRRGAAIDATEDGVWTMDAGHPALRSARQAARKRVNLARRRQADRFDPAVYESHERRLEALRSAHAEELAQLRRVLVHAFPAKQPQAIVLVDVAQRELTTYCRDQLDTARARLNEYDWIGAVGVRPLLKALDFDAASRRLAELGPPQKSCQLNRQGRTLKITTKLLIQGSCGISKPLADAAKLRQYLRQGQTKRLHRRLEADAKSLFALYQFGRLHGAVRLRWGFLDDWLRVPWVHRDEPTLYDLKKQAFEHSQALELVLGSAPGWENPWSRARRCTLVPEGRYRWLAIDEDGFGVDDGDVQLARLVPVAA